jgi:hypothetical protein
MHKIKGQSILEYVLLAMLVITTITVMGPYLIRSVGTHFKLWQESIDDTVNDRMPKVPVKIPGVDCKCSNFVDGPCGGHMQLTNDRCPPDKIYQYKQCTPQAACGIANGLFQEQCSSTPISITTPKCCDIFNACTKDSPLSTCCGSAPIDPAHPRPTTVPPYGFPAVSSPTPDRNNPSSYCYSGEELMFGQCDITKIQCKPNPSCQIMCEGNLPRDINGVVRAHLCLNADTNLVHNLDIQVMSDPWAPCPDYTKTPTPRKCVAKCDPRYLPKVLGTESYCSPAQQFPYQVAPIIANTTNDLSFTTCNPDTTVTQVFSASAPGSAKSCGNPGYPGAKPGDGQQASCIAYTW